MDVVRVNDLDFRPFISHETIRQRISEMAVQISHDLSDCQPLFIGILNGAFMFAADLLREVNIDSEITFVKLASYEGTASTGRVTTRIGMDKSVEGRTVVIVEDIVDTGKTLNDFLKVLETEKAKRILIAALLLKPESLQHKIPVDYVGFRVPNDFLIGYGLDYDGLGRNLKDIYVKA